MQKDTDILKKLFSGEAIYAFIIGRGIIPRHTEFKEFCCLPLIFLFEASFEHS